MAYKDIEERRAYGRKYNREHREARNIYNRKWERDNKDIIREWNRVGGPRKVKWQRERRKRLRGALVDWCGSSCCICKTVDNQISFHHIDRDTKSFGIQAGLTRKLDVLWVELNKCIAVCRSCHTSLHREDLYNGRWG